MSPRWCGRSALVCTMVELRPGSVSSPFDGPHKTKYVAFFEHRQFEAYNFLTVEDRSISASQMLPIKRSFRNAKYVIFFVFFRVLSTVKLSSFKMVQVWHTICEANVAREKSFLNIWYGVVSLGGICHNSKYVALF